MISLAFLYFFLPLFMAAYAVLPGALRGKFVALTGAGIIAWIEPVALIPVAVCVITAYLGGIFINNLSGRPSAKTVLAASVIINAAAFLLFHRTVYDRSDILTLFGAASFLKKATFVGMAVIPMNAISYCVDVYRKKYKCEHRFMMLAEYLLFFPIFFAGPLIGYGEVSKGLEKHDLSFSSCAAGIRLLMLGMFSKLVIANTMYELWEHVRDIPIESLPALTGWIGIMAFGFFMYFEVRGFSDMARGLAQMLGIVLPKNFHEPYRSVSFMDFLRRFNRSLYRWCHSYIYRSVRSHTSGSMGRFFAFVLAVSAGTFWYGTSMRSLVFAAMLIFMMSLEMLLSKPLRKLPKLARTLIFVAVLMMILPFMAFTNINDAFSYLMAMFGSSMIAVDNVSEYLLGTYLLFFVVCIFISGGIFGYFFRKKVFMNEYLHTIIQPVWVIALLMICTAFLVAGDTRLFTYMF